MQRSRPARYARAESSVNAWLSQNAKGERSIIVRLERGRYRLLADDAELARLDVGLHRDQAEEMRRSAAPRILHQFDH